MENDDDTDEERREVVPDPHPHTERTGGKQAGTDPRRTGRPEGGKPQPGGGHRSESEKPDSPDSRWGGGRNARRTR
jgi:hypothetical protein